MADVPMEAQFRVNKRRKVFRKREASNEDGFGQSLDGPSSRPEVEALPASEAEEDIGRTQPTVIKPAAKRRGLAASSGGQQRPIEENAAYDSALVPVREEDIEPLSSADRFVRPTGRVGVVEDKHLTAYIDMKLAERRQTTLSPTVTPDGSVEPREPDPSAASTQPGALVNGLPSREQIGLSKTTRLGNDTLPAQNDARPRPRQQQSAAAKPASRTRGGRARDPRALERDSLVDALLRENPSLAGGMYAAPNPHSRLAAVVSGVREAPAGGDADSGEDGAGDGAMAIDNDAAVAQAFKTEFLADLDARHARRRAQNPPPTHPSRQGQAAAAAAPSGPKLGGSRSQREKMRTAAAAAQLEGKGGAGAKK